MNRINRMGLPAGRQGAVRVRNILSILFILSIVLSGCAAPQVTIPSGVASVLYAQARADYAVAKVLITQACASGRWDRDACEAARQIDQRAQVQREAIERALMDQRQPIDWAQVLQYTQAISALLMAARVLP